MGKGIALDFKNKFPLSARAYQIYVDNARAIYGKKGLGNLLGFNCIREEESGIITCSMFAQEYYGYQGKYTDYTAFRRCCRELVHYLKAKNSEKIWRIGMPYHIGCGLSGGSWDTIYQILVSCFEFEPNLELVLYRKI